MICSRGCKQFALLTKKNWLLQKRKIALTLAEIFIPVLLSLVLLLIRIKIKSEFVATPITEPSFSVTNELFIPGLRLAFTPINNVTENTMKAASRFLNTSESQGFDKEIDLENAFSNDTRIGNKTLKFFGGIVFLPTSYNESGFTENITYKVRLRAEQLDGMAGTQNIGDWLTEAMMPFSSLVGPRQKNSTEGGKIPGYYKEGFLTIQRAIDFSIIAEINKSGPDNKKTLLKKFAFPPYLNDAFVFILQTQFPFIIMLSFIVIAPSICSEVCHEKEKRLKEYMKLLGLSNSINWFAWLFKYAILMLISVSFMTILFHVKPGGAAVISYTHPSITFVFLFLYTLSIISFCFAITTFFNKASSAAAAGALGFLLTYFPQFFLYFYFDTMGTTGKILLSLIPNLAMSLGCRAISKFEGIGVGVQWNKLNWGPDTYDTYSMLHTMIMLVVDIVIFAIITWYVDSIRPGEFGTPKPFYFPFQKKYWCGGRSSDDMDYLFEEFPDYGPRAHLFEPNPQTCEVGIKIRHLTKIFSKKSKPAVNDLSLDICEGKITALLGHNGAGKTTTMSMLTGFMPPTRGTAFINGFNIRQDMDNIRQSLGLCPQFNILFDVLTVEEHLHFFSELKGCDKHEIGSEVDKMIRLLRLEDKSNVLTKALSGGMKRKLSVGIALIGGSRFVILDEPSSGMDPEVRRHMWDVLKTQQKGRTMILTTHYMDEADYLGDKIAIMADGAVHCYGSSLFLKRKYGIGYHLTMVKAGECDPAKVDHLIKTNVEDAQLESSAGAELTYILPKEHSSTFSTLFTQMENNGDELGIASFGASVTTLEEVFIKVGELCERDNEEEAALKEPLALHDSQDFGSSRTTVVEDSQSIRVEGLMLIFLKMYALLHKKFLHTWRNRLISLIQIIVPVSFAIIACLISFAIPKKLDPPPLTLDLAKYKNPVTLFAAPNGTSPYLDCFEKAIRKIRGTSVYLNNQSFEYTDEKDMDRYVVKLAQENFYDYRTKYQLAAEVGSDYLMGFYNDESYHTIAMAMSLIDNGWLQCSSPASASIKISTINHPLPWSAEARATKSRNATNMVGFAFSYLVMFGLAFLIATFVVFLINERVSGAKSSQYVSGATSGTFWLATFVWDYFNFLIPSALVVVVIVAFQMDGFSSGVNPGFIFLGLLLYGWSVLPSTYLLSFFFSKGSSGFVWSTVINIFTGTASALAILILKTPQLNLMDLANRLEWFFYILFPNFCFEKTLQDLYANYQNSELCKVVNPGGCSNRTNPCCPDTCGDNCLMTQQDVFSWNYPGIGRSLTFMAIQGLVFFLVLFVVESDIINSIKRELSPQVLLVDDDTSIHPSNSNLREDDDDVSEEKSNVLKLDRSELASDDNVLVLKCLTKRYSGNFLAVNKLCLKVPRGECFGLLGINGAGKTSTFKMLTGDEMITGGNVFIRGIDVARHLAQTRKHVGYCPQFDALIDQMTVKENLELHARLRGIPQKKIEKLIIDLTNKLTLFNYINEMAGKLSGGNKRKLGVAIALVGDPLLVFLDEPSAGMDPVARRELWNSVSAVRDSGSTIILTSHSMEECEALCTRLAIMVNGRFKCLGSPQHLKSKFGAGYSVVLKTSQILDQSTNSLLIRDAKEFVMKQFPGSTVEFEGEGMLNYRIEKSTPGATLGNIFGLLESSKELLKLDDYSVGQATLEQIFINFARTQRSDEELRKGGMKRKCRSICCCLQKTSNDE